MSGITGVIQVQTWGRALQVEWTARAVDGDERALLRTGEITATGASWGKEEERVQDWLETEAAGHVQMVWKFLKMEAGDLPLFKMKEAAREYCSHHVWGKLHNLEKYIIIIF